MDLRCRIRRDGKTISCGCWNPVRGRLEPWIGATKKYQAVAEVPGFTRGLDFCGPVAFVGLSQVRESAVFSGIPITERTQESTCGVWAIHIQTGEILGWVKFEDAVQEIFAVRVVPGIRFPDLVNHDMKLLDGSFVLPDADLLRVPQVYLGGISQQ